jgi:glycosyltransferase involved in cell wall biosynthesis
MITVAAICKNEEALIEPWIDILNASGIVEKILILDTGSTDKTIQKINNKKVKLYQQEWNGNFSAPRNFLIEEAKNINTNFLWMLDIDEIPSKNLINFLKFYHIYK